MVEITSADDAAGGGYKHDRRVIIYPSYINSRCSVAEGRRIPKDAACDAPNVLEIRDVLEKSMKLPCEVEDKSYPKDFWQRGRVRVTIKKDDGTPIAREFPTRRAVMLEIARLVPKHPGRQPGAPKDKKTMPTALEILTQFSSQPGQAGASSGAGGGGGGGGSSKKDKGGKKGKKGRRYLSMHGGDGSYYVGGDDRGGGGGDPSANVGFQSDKLDASYHSPAWQEAHIKSLQDFKRPTLEEFKRAEKEREGKLQANAEATERETAAFRKQLEADRERRLAGGRNHRKDAGGVRKGKVSKKDRKREKKRKKDGKKKKDKKEKKEKKEKKSKRSKRSSSSGSSSGSSDSESGGGGGDDDDTEKFRLSGFFSQKDD